MSTFFSITCRADAAAHPEGSPCHTRIKAGRGVPPTREEVEA